MATNGTSSGLPVMDYAFASGQLTLSGHLSTPDDGAGGSPGLVLCHGFPTRGRESPAVGQVVPGAGRSHRGGARAGRCSR